MDVDTGVDDAMAITLATRLPKVQVEAVTVVAGNGNLSTGYDNTLRTLNAIDRTDVSSLPMCGCTRGQEGAGVAAFPLVT